MSYSRRFIWPLAALTLAAMLLAPAWSARAARPATAAHATVHVSIQGFAFSPHTLTVAPGTTVVWTNKDSAAHTVTSDSNAWTDSGSIAQGKSFTLTLTKPGAYPYHCAFHSFMTATLVVAAHGASGMSGQGGMSAMGPRGTATLTAYTGYYDGHTLMYIATDTSSKAEAAHDHINYAPALGAARGSASKIYLITNGAFAGRGPVFGTKPGESDYTPLWQEVRVTWKNPAAASALGSDTQINDLAKAGKLTLTMTGVVLNCPIIMGTM